MKERPIIFSGEMVRAILDGRKTQTRRVIKPQPKDQCFAIGKCKYYPFADNPLRAICDRKRFIDACPYGQPGDRLWVREKHSFIVRDPRGLCDPVWYWADGNPSAGDWTVPRPSIHMPRWASRITLEITNVRVERVQNISEEDALLEGIGFCLCDHLKTRAERKQLTEDIAKGSRVKAFSRLWDSINAKRGYSWESNPWVWVIGFKVVK